ncbi:trypsin-like peptidase domain-containing protein [Larkinella arboricola]|uniref:Trypsin-like peptidase n=1 Tax=Larkinella arboricola TaxID=643671 RepID=A0A327WW14_LARAB|nr:trypsin-like peptidase domain-containing protein [Larkinella arboricola]RAJ97501.1 trypsin-like peptidase [Larkinella arboricola]
MFVEAIERVDPFVRPILSIVRRYGSSEVIPACSTMFFVNEQAYAVTCKHVAEQLIQSETIHQNYLKFQGERRSIMRAPNSARRLEELEKKYNLRQESIIQIKNQFGSSFDQSSRITYHLHPTQDLAVIHFEGYNQLKYNSCAVFLRDSSKIRQGRSLCRLGYPFPEFTNYRYNAERDEIEWTTDGRTSTPRFPIDGIVTRLRAENNEVVGVEMSTPGLRGQSGGPLFDTNGIIYGMQSSTRHLHLGFDIEDREVIVNGRLTRVSNYPFLNVGQCVHVDIIKKFLRELNIKFYEG